MRGLPKVEFAKSEKGCGGASESAPKPSESWVGDSGVRFGAFLRDGVFGSCGRPFDVELVDAAREGRRCLCDIAVFREV